LLAEASPRATTGLVRWLKIGLVACGLLACVPVTNVCNQRKEEMLRADGGAYGCTIAEECPRQSNVLVCTTDGLPDRDCVSCEDGAPGIARCVRHIAVFCY
jgi:hypothetical protein